jgi:hypothetical protein
MLKMSDTKQTNSDGWGPYGPPSTWRKQFQERDYNEFMSKKVAEYNANPNFIGFGRRTASQILDDDEKERLEMSKRADIPFSK